ncbi:MAG: hypothetical protein M1825_003261 [Sarcosagium campestre]|nr:MAG: hypothetical protein M1825_003261 [Sarcosagium campestre]
MLWSTLLLPLIHVVALPQPIPVPIPGTDSWLSPQVINILDGWIEFYPGEKIEPGTLERIGSQLIEDGLEASSSDDSQSLYTVCSTSDCKWELEVEVPDANKDKQTITGDLLVQLASAINQIKQVGDFVFSAIFKSRKTGAAVNLHLFNAQKRKQKSRKVHPFDAQDVTYIYKAKDAIVNVTTPNDLILFLGGSASYIYFAFKPTDNRNAEIIPFSGQPTTQALQINADLVQDYTDNVLRPAFTAKKWDRCLVVDFIETGKSIKSFMSVLDMSGVVDSRDCRVLPLTPGTTPSRLKEKAGLEPLAEIPFTTTHAELNRFVNADVGRVLPPYPLSYWGIPWQVVKSPDLQSQKAIAAKIRRGPMKMSSSGSSIAQYLRPSKQKDESQSASKGGIDFRIKEFIY